MSTGVASFPVMEREIWQQKTAQKVMLESLSLLGSAKNQKQPRLGRLVPEAALPEARFSGQSLPFF